MTIRYLLLLFFISSLFACSSSGGRAPVSDLTASQNAAASSSTVNRAQKGSLNKKNYRVQKGDTLYSIGWRSGVDVKDLIRLNDLNSPYIIKIGQELKLAADKVKTAAKENNKSDLASLNVNKTTKSACTGQKCQKNKPKSLAPEKTKAYSANKVDKKELKVKEKANKNPKISAWLWPVKGKLTKKFSNSEAGLQGISIVNERGSAITATASGQVVYAGSGLRGYGKLIIIKHNFDYLSAYAHNETILVRENENIKKGQKIATMGDSGTGYVHLHFEIRYKGKSVDPLRYLPKQ